MVLNVCESARRTSRTGNPEKHVLGGDRRSGGDLWVGVVGYRSVISRSHFRLFVCGIWVKQCWGRDRIPESKREGEGKIGSRGVR